MIYDVAIIGVGVVGAMVARELTRLGQKVVLLEKASDVAVGASRACFKSADKRINKAAVEKAQILQLIRDLRD